MKIKIGPYKYWVGPYQIADLLQKVGVSEDKCHEIAEAMPQWVNTVCNWIYNKRKRKVKILIDDWDTWGMDETLAHIIVPMLKQLRDETHGYPQDFCTEEDIGGLQYKFEDEGFEFPEDTGFKGWQATLDEMIWAFEQCLIDWEDQYYTGKADFNFEKIEDGLGYSKMVHGPNHTLEADYEGMRAHQDRMQKGFDLFGKYYRNLWD